MKKNVKIHNKTTIFLAVITLKSGLGKPEEKLRSTAHKPRKSKAPKTQRANLWLTNTVLHH